MRIYIASPYSDGGANQTQSDLSAAVDRQIDAAEELARRGHMPVVPLLSHYWQQRYAHQWNFWMQLSYSHIETVDALLRLDGRSVGADAEVRKAKSLGIPVYYDIDSVPDVAKR